MRAKMYLPFITIIFINEKKQIEFLVFIFVILLINSSINMTSHGSDVVKVAVRVRPFNEREIQEKAKCCVEMVGDETHIYSPEGKQYKFTYNYCYWSQNKYDEHYASQEVVYNDLGKSVLDNAWEGYNTSLFAYGQTGAGKVCSKYFISWKRMP
jgi:hypothetical protein